MAAGLATGVVAGAGCTLEFLAGFYNARNSDQRCSLSGSGDAGLCLAFFCAGYIVGECVGDRCNGVQGKHPQSAAKEDVRAIPISPLGSDAKEGSYDVHVVNPLVNDAMPELRPVAVGPFAGKMTGCSGAAKGDDCQPVIPGKEN